MTKTKSPPIPDGLLELDVISLGGQEVNLNYYFSQEYTDIDQATLELPNLIEWINGQLHVMYEDKLNCEQQLKRAESAAFFALKSGAYVNLYGGKVTDKALGYAVTLDEGVQTAWTQLNRLTAWCRRLHNLQSSLQARLDLIRSSESTRRRLVDQFENEPEAERRTDQD